MNILQHLDPCACISNCSMGLTARVDKWQGGSNCIYEEELRDLLTYDCLITGRKRCPPCSSDNLKENKSIKILNCNGKKF